MTYTLPEGDYQGPYKWFSVDTLMAEVDKAYKQGFSHGLKECTPWQDAVIDGLVVAHVYRKEHDTDPRLALQDLISWHVRVALDPTVSSDARALVESGERVKQGLLEALKALLDDVGPANSMLGAIKARAALAAAQEVGK